MVVIRQSMYCSIYQQAQCGTGECCITNLPTNINHLHTHRDIIHSVSIYREQNLIIVSTSKCSIVARLS